MPEKFIPKPFPVRTQVHGAALCVAIAGLCAAQPAKAERIANQIAVFSALDKVTARISKFEVALNTTVTFGSIKVTPRVCYSRPATELPKTTTFVEVDEMQLDGKEKRIFTGWMFAESPGIFGVEHPTIDVWLTECTKPVKATAQKAPAPAAASTAKTGETEGGGAVRDEVPARETDPASDEPDAPAAEPRRRARR